VGGERGGEAGAGSGDKEGKGDSCGNSGGWLSCSVSYTGEQLGARVPGDRYGE